ncbi:MAG: hypothetical protein NVSMB32_06270 [Actinomycetota bacterium]
MAIRIGLLGLLLVFLVVCGAHVGGLSHDAASGTHSLEVGIVIVWGAVLGLGALAAPQPVLRWGGGEPWTAVAPWAASGMNRGVLIPLRC